MALLSRIADALYWTGRYVERAENTARLLDVTYHGRLEPTSAEVAGATNTWEALVATLGLGAAYDQWHHQYTERSVVEFLTVSRQNPSSIVSSLIAARENARACRSFLSSETWVAVNRLHHAAIQRNIDLILADGLYDFCDMVRLGAQTFLGTAAHTSMHDEGYWWLTLGTHIERADMVSRLIDSKYHLLMPSLDDVGGPVDRYQWGAVLRSLSGYEAFRRTRTGGIDGPRVIAFLLLDPAFPRSLRASVDAALAALEAATEGAEPRLRNPAMRLAAALQSRLEYETGESVIAGGLHEFLTRVQDDLSAIHLAVSESFFWARSAA